MDEPALSRIVVEHETEWIRIQDNLAQGLQTSMEARLASLPGGKDGPAARKVRKELEQRIKKISEEAFKLAKPNLRVNGHNYEDYVEATEPVDEKLDRAIKGLHAERVGWEGALIKNRRENPAAINRTTTTVEAQKTRGEWYPQDDVAVNDEGDIAKDIPKPDRYQDTVDTFTTVASNLSELAEVAPAQLARAQRAHTVREEIAQMGS